MSRNFHESRIAASSRLIAAVRNSGVPTTELCRLSGFTQPQLWQVMNNGRAGRTRLRERLELLALAVGVPVEAATKLAPLKGEK
jgi:hypothetical protein